MKEAVYTPQEVADALKVSRGTVLRWCRDGTVKAIKAGKQWRIPVDQVKKILSGERGANAL